MATVEDVAGNENLSATRPASSPMEEDLEKKRDDSGEDEFRIPGSKRKARTSPGIPSMSEEEHEGAISEAKEQGKIIIRKRKVRSKKVCRNTETLIDLSEDSSPVESADDLERKENEREMIENDDEIGGR